RIQRAAAWGSTSGRETGSIYHQEMTYCLAWKLRNAVFLVADAAVTGGSMPLRETRSSFGELHKAGPTKVQQAALKVFHLPGERGLTFAGDVRVGHELVRAMAEFLSHGSSTIDAAKAGLANVCPVPKGVDPPVAAYGSVTDGVAELLVLDTRRGT